MKKILNIINSLIFSTHVQALEHSSIPFQEATSAVEISNILSNLGEGSIILVDIDDTIITPSSVLFRRAPFNKLIDDLKKNKEKYPRYEEILSNWRLQRKAILTDQEWPRILRKLKEKHRVYGLTKMDIGQFGHIKSMESWRYDELKSLNIVFTLPSEVSLQSVDGSCFYKGILMTGKHSKSQTIQNYYNHLKTHTLVMIDDRKEHLEDIKIFCEHHSIHFIGILFKGMEKFKDNVDPAAASLQKQYLLHNAQWLEDDEAAKLLKQSH